MESMLLFRPRIIPVVHRMVRQLQQGPEYPFLALAAASFFHL